MLLFSVLKYSMLSTTCKSTVLQCSYIFFVNAVLSLNRALQRVLQSIQNSTACENSSGNSQNAVSKCDAGSTCSATEKSSASGASADGQPTDMWVLYFQFEIHCHRIFLPFDHVDRSKGSSSWPVKMLLRQIPYFWWSVGFIREDYQNCSV